MAGVAAIAAAASPGFAQQAAAPSTTDRNAERGGSRCMTRLDDLRTKRRNSEKFTQLDRARDFDRAP